MMKQIIQIFGAILLIALLISACGLLGSDDDKDNEPIQIRIFNQTGFDFEWHRLRISLADSNDFEVNEFEFPELSDGEMSEYVHIPMAIDFVGGYLIRFSFFSEYFGFIRDLGLHSDFNEDRAEPITGGNYTYIAEYTSHDFVYYTLFQDDENEEEVRIRVRNTGELDYEQVSVWLWDDEDFMGREFEIGPVAVGQNSSYYTVENALEYTRVRVLTVSGDTLDNEPLDHFANELLPGDYTYQVQNETTNLKDNSRLVKD